MKGSTSIRRSCWLKVYFSYGHCPVAHLGASNGRSWDNQLAAYVSASFKTQNLAAVAHEGVNLIGKLVNAATLWYGAHLVMDNQLSVGQFVAFNMFAQRVSQPIMRMAQLWTDFQQTGLTGLTGRFGKGP